MERNTKLHKIRNEACECIAAACTGSLLSMMFIYWIGFWCIGFTITTIVSFVLLFFSIAIAEPPKKGGFMRWIGWMDDDGYLILRKKNRQIYRVESRSKEFNYIHR